jgi:hypothetical protein
MGNYVVKQKSESVTTYTRWSYQSDNTRLFKNKQADEVALSPGGCLYRE